MPNEQILLILSDPELGQFLEQAALTPAGYQTTLVTEWKTAESLLSANLPHLIIVNEEIEGRNSIGLVGRLFEQYPPIPVILILKEYSGAQVLEATRQGFADCLPPPVRVQDVQSAVPRALERARRMQDWASLEARRSTKGLEKRIDGLEAIQRVGHKVTSLLDLDHVLTAVVDAAVEMTNAEEGSLLLLDETTGELYMRAGRNFHEEFVRTFRLPIRSSLAGQVLRTGKPLLIDEETPQKIKTSYLVYTIIYVPLTIQERVIGVLEVDNRKSRKPFTEYHVALMSALANYAAIAIENARLYSRSEMERNKLETILTEIEDGAIVVDLDGRIMLVNRKARDAFGIFDKNLVGKRLSEVIHHQELLEFLREREPGAPSRVEITLEDGRVLNTQLTSISQVGLAITMQDITHLKELDRIKSDFVNTVSHDLRSPLTAILGYVELMDRVGSLNEQQREFIQRIQLSVHNITALINDLLDLGRIEAGFDVRKEVMPFSVIVHYTIDGLKNRAEDRGQHLILEAPDELPQILGNPVRLRQMLNNLVVNAIKYTPEGGEIIVRVQAENGQIITQIVDNGPGIPPTDQPYIFDKFYRASNIPNDTPGTGLGLAIVKSIVENHLGRIWVDSTIGQGTVFTVVFPAVGK